MARKGKKSKAKPIVTVDEKRGTVTRFIPTTINKTIDSLMSAQRPAVLAHLRGIQHKRPHATVAEITQTLERRYLATVTTSGAATGATAVIPAVGTITALALSAAETAAFLEATALFAQSVAELHGVAVTDPDRARGLVLALMLGREGSAIIKQWGLEALNEDATRAGYWSVIASEQVPNVIITPLLNRLKNAFIKKFAVRSGTHALARALPYGVGAVIGGFGNNVVGRRVVKAARDAFPPTDLVVLPFPSAAASAELAEQEAAPVRELTR